MITEEIDGQHMKQEVQRLRELEIRYASEKEFHQNERQTQTLLLQNLETIKSNIQKSEVEGKLKLESNLSELNRECSALRRRLQEGEDRYRETLSNIELEKQKLKDSVVEKDALIISLKNNLSVIEDELRMKNSQLTELNSKCETSNYILQNGEDSQSLIRELKKKIEENNIETSSLSQQLSMAREHAKQFSQMAEKAERDLKSISGELEAKNHDLDKEVKVLKERETFLKEKVQSMERDFLIQKTNLHVAANTNEKEELENLRKELTDALSTINEIKGEAACLRTQYMEASEDLRLAEQKYANEMILHSADIQAYSCLKKEYQQLLDEYNNTKLSKESTSNVLSKHQEMLLSVEEKHQTEKQNLESHIQDLQSHNSLLLDQIETLGSKLAVFVNHNDQNISFDEDRSKSSDELLRIIKYLRREKEIAISKLELVNNESVRIKTENKMLQKNLNKLSEHVKETPSEAQMMIATTIKHEELLRKLETINAITDSNRVLREERDSLAAHVKDLSETISKIQSELLPLKEKDQELSMKLEAFTNENASLRIEVTRWRQRANLLVERSNKSSPEDMKRLQQEKENLCKVSMIT